MVELTVPWEEAFDEANERKRAQYAEMDESVRRKHCIRVVTWLKASEEGVEEHLSVFGN